MTPDEVNERAWQQMRSMTDDEIMKHEAADELLLDTGDEPELNIWDFRLAVRGFFFNELWREVRILK